MNDIRGRRKGLRVGRRERIKEREWIFFMIIILNGK
jgi:hypothetical protein